MKHFPFHFFVFMGLEMEQNVLFICTGESSINALPQPIIVIFDNSVIFLSTWRKESWKKWKPPTYSNNNKNI